MDEANKDVLHLTAEEFAQLEEYQLQAALQQLAGYMACAQAEMREHSGGYHAYLAAKDNFSYLKQTASTLQTLIRSAV